MSTNPPLTNGGSIGIPLPGEYTGGGDCHKVPGKWLKRASGATVRFMIPLHHNAIIIMYNNK